MDSKKTGLEKNQSSKEELSSSSEGKGMRVGAGQFKIPTEERLRFIKQLGIEDVILNLLQSTPQTGQLPLSGRKEWSFRELVQLRNRVEDMGLRLAAIENIPTYFYDKVMLGREGSKEQLEHVKRTVANIGRANIPILGYNWMPSGVWRTSRTRRVRGGAQATAFELAQVADSPLTHGREYREEEMWKNYERFLEEVLPVAEESGVKLALHPCDPPVEKLGGVPFIFRDFESFKRADQLAESKYHGLELCLGTWSEMGENIVEVIQYFGERNKIFYVHFRDVEGTVPSFHEIFLNEGGGNYDKYEVLKTLREVGFQGVMIVDHVPRVEGDSKWGHRARANAIGYLQGLVRGLDEN